MISIIRLESVSLLALSAVDCYCLRAKYTQST